MYVVFVTIVVFISFLIIVIYDQQGEPKLIYVIISTDFQVCQEKVKMMKVHKKKQITKKHMKNIFILITN